MSNLSTIPTEAATLIRERGWTQNSFETRDGALCLHGAIRACTPQKGDAEIVRALARRQGFTEYWNDGENRTESEVLDALAHVDTSDAALDATFGPQWEHVVALVRRAATLTEDEADRLRVVWSSAGGVASWRAIRRATLSAPLSAAQVVAQVVARTAAQEAAQEAARATTQDAAQDTAWDATWDAAWALVVRDLIGQHGFTQDHYDTLTAQWAAVIGPAHPDD